MARVRYRSLYSFLAAYKKTLMLVISPLIIALIPLSLSDGSNNKAMNCAFVILLMAFFWMTEVLPIAVTALLPMVLLPPLGVMSSKNICINYLKDTTMLLFVGMAVAIAVEKCNLHRRVALRVLLMMGSQPKWLMFGFMFTTAFLSMWISNTAATAMMIPIVHAVLGQLKTNLDEKAKLVRGSEELQDINVLEPPLDPPEIRRGSNKERSPEMKDLDKEMANFKSINVGLRLCVCYASSIGGTATLTGTPANLVLPGFMDDQYGAEAAKGVDFVSWFIFGAPTMIVVLIGAWLCMLLFYLGPRVLFSKKATDQSASDIIRHEYNTLGQMSFSEKMVLAHFCILALLWLLRDPKFTKGWGELFGSAAPYISDASVGMTIVVSLFIFPIGKPPFACWTKPTTTTIDFDSTEPSSHHLEEFALVEHKPPTDTQLEDAKNEDDNVKVKEGEGMSAKDEKNAANHATTDDDGPVASLPDFTSQPSLLDWHSVHHKVSWSAMLILGAGFALAKATEKSNLAALIGSYLAKLDYLPHWVIVMIFCVFVAAMTQITSNTGTVAIFLPVASRTADAIRINPYFATMGPTYAASLAFMLPVSTPPNALVLGYGHVTISDMAKSGGILVLMSVFVLQLSLNGYVYPAFGFSNYPSWAPANITIT